MPRDQRNDPEEAQKERPECLFPNGSHANFASNFEIPMSLKEGEEGGTGGGGGGGGGGVRNFPFTKTTATAE